MKTEKSIGLAVIYSELLLDRIVPLQVIKALTTTIGVEDEDLEQFVGDLRKLPAKKGGAA